MTYNYNPEPGDVIYKSHQPQFPLLVVSVSSSGNLTCVNLKGEYVTLPAKAYGCLSSLIDETERKLSGHKARMSELMGYSAKAILWEKEDKIKIQSRFQALLETGPSEVWMDGDRLVLVPEMREGFGVNPNEIS